MTFSFVIPSYRNPSLLNDCIKSIRSFYPTTQIIVVDDASNDERIKQICEKHNCFLKTSFHNNGFSYNCNRGIEASNSGAVVLINNDVILTCDILAEAEKVLTKDPQIGIMGFLLYYPDGRIQHGGLKFDSLVSMTHEDVGLDPKDANLGLKSRYIIATTGALMIIKKAMTDKIGAFNAGYGLAFEDTELCLRAWHCGWRVYYNADVSAIHYEGYTRGVTTEQKKLCGSWDKEQISHQKYLKDIQNYSFYDIINKTRILN